MPPSLPVVVPALNEAERLPALLDDLHAQRADEVIVSDGGSLDGTVDCARSRAHVLHTPRGRAIQMNAGARAATGDVLLFLHADCRLEAGGLDAVRRAMLDPAVAGGAFDIRYEGGDLPARVFTAVNRVRQRCGIIYGDAGIFCRRERFRSLGGYREWPILEDYEFARRLWKSGRMALLPDPIRVSDRRWRKSGLLRTLASWFLIQSLYYARVSPERLARLYPHVR